MFTQKEIKWVARLQRVLDAQPESLSAYDNESGIAFFKGSLPNDGTGGVDAKKEHLEAKPKRGLWERGAW